MLKYTPISLKDSVIPPVPPWGLVSYSHSDSGVDCSLPIFATWLAGPPVNGVLALSSSVAVWFALVWRGIVIFCQLLCSSSLSHEAGSVLRNWFSKNKNKFWFKVFAHFHGVNAKAILGYPNDITEHGVGKRCAPSTLELWAGRCQACTARGMPHTAAVGLNRKASRTELRLPPRKLPQTRNKPLS